MSELINILIALGIVVVVMAFALIAVTALHRLLNKLADYINEELNKLDR
jgi:hypothetical protein